MDPNDAVILYTTSHEPEAEIIRLKLQEAGINCQLAGTNQGGFAAVLEVKILVPAADVARARELISEHLK